MEAKSVNFLMEKKVVFFFFRIETNNENVIISQVSLKLVIFQLIVGSKRLNLKVKNSLEFLKMEIP